MNGIAELRRRCPWPETRPGVMPDDHGWFQECNARLLRRFIGPETALIVELGSWLGKSTRFMLRTAPRATVICIDHFKGSPRHRHHAARDKLPRLYETFLRNLWDSRHRVVPLRTDTVAGMREVWELKLAPDLIYVDAGHDYPDVLQDVTTAIELFPTARLTGDDWLYFDGVRRAVTEVARIHGRQIVREENAWALQ